MIDARYSADAFARLGPDTPEAQQLAHALSSEIRAEMQGAIEAVLCRVVARLRDLGHNLCEVDRVFGFYSSNYSFLPGDPSPPDGCLGLSFDTTALVFYAGIEADSPASAAAEQGSGHLADGDEVPF
jgi:hypothetical protein